MGERLRKAIEEYGPPRRGRPGATGGIKAFHDRMEAMAEAGEIPEEHVVTYQMLHRYLPKDSNPDPALPSEGFLQVVAKVLSKESGEHVRWKWIATGEGEPTKEESRARKEVSGVSRANVAISALDQLEALRLQHDVLEAIEVDGPPPPPEPPDELETLGDLGGESDEAIRWRDEVRRAMESRTVALWTAPVAELRRRLRAREHLFRSDVPRTEAHDIGWALAGPLQSLGVNPRLMDRDTLNDYIVSMVPVLIGLVPEIERQGENTEPEESDNG